MNPTCRHLMRYRTPCLMPCRYCVTDLRDPPGPPLAETVVIHPERDVDQTKGATADAVKGSYVDDHIYKMPLLPCTVPGWTCGDWHGRLLSHEIPWHAVVRQVRLGSI
jgi:hypothetical protein